MLKFYTTQWKALGASFSMLDGFTKLILSLLGFVAAISFPAAILDDPITAAIVVMSSILLSAPIIWVLLKILGSLRK